MKKPKTKVMMKKNLKEQVETMSSGLHPFWGPEWWNIYKTKANVLYFHPQPLTKDAYEEHPQTQDKGVWFPHKPSSSEVSFLLKIDKSKKTISSISSLLRDPRQTRALTTSANLIPELKDYEVVQISQDPSNDKNYGKLGDLLSKLKAVQGRSPSWTHDREKEQEYQEFKFQVFEEVADVDWFHATSIKHLQSIMKTGLKPSKIAAQGTGWTQLNFHLQNAVYLTSDLEYASDIAETLLGRTGEPGIVLRINGSTLKDYSKIVVDEDSLRNEIDGSVSGGMIIQDLPDFMTSLLDSIQSIGYKDTINPSFLKVEMVLDLEKKPEGWNEEYDGEFDPEVLQYTWEEWKSESMKESISTKLKRVLKEQVNEQEEAPPADDFDLPEPPDAGGGDTPDSTDGDMTDAGTDGADASLDGGLDGGGSGGELGDDGEPLDGDADGGDMDFDGGGFSGGFGGGGGGGGFDFGGGDDAGGDDTEADAADGESQPEEAEENADPVSFAVEQAKQMAEENQSIQQILNVVKSVVTDRAITPEQLNSIVQQLKAENDVVLSAVSNRLLMFTKGF